MHTPHFERYQGNRKHRRLQAKCEARSVAIQEQLEREEAKCEARIAIQEQMEREALKRKLDKEARDLFQMNKKRRTQLLGYSLESVLGSVPSRVLKDMSDDTLQELSYQIRKAEWTKKAFCTPRECTREEAIAKGELGGYVAGELGTHYFFFETKAISDDQRQQIQDHTACCFMRGQPCACQLEPDEPCECQMGADNGSYWFQMNLGPGTFQSECDVDLIKPKFVRTFKSGDFKSGVVTVKDNIYSMDELKECFDLNNMDVDDLVKAAAFLKNPEHPVELKETIAGTDGLATYTVHTYTRK